MSSFVLPDADGLMNSYLGPKESCLDADGSTFDCDWRELCFDPPSERTLLDRLNPSVSAMLSVGEVGFIEKCPRSICPRSILWWFIGAPREEGLGHVGGSEKGDDWNSEEERKEDNGSKVSSKHSPFESPRPSFQQGLTTLNPTGLELYRDDDATRRDPFRGYAVILDGLELGSRRTSLDTWSSSLARELVFKGDARTLEGSRANGKGCSWFWQLCRLYLDLITEKRIIRPKTVMFSPPNW